MIDSAQITQRIREFKKDLRQGDLKKVVTKHLTTGKCQIYDDEMYAQLKTDAADFMKVHPNDVIIVGSAKLGFSIASKQRTIDPDTGKKSEAKRYQHFSIEDSDIDIAVCNARIFDEHWLIAHDYHLTGQDWTKKGDFRKYLFDGWIRPDYLPTGLNTAWKEFFAELSTQPPYNQIKSGLKCGVYKDWQFLERYQFKAVEECKIEDDIEQTRRK